MRSTGGEECGDMGRVAAAVLILISTAASVDCAIPSRQRPGIEQERAMSVDEVLKALRAHDWGVIRLAVAAPPSTVAEIERALPQLDDEAREIAVALLVRQNAPNVGQLLLKMTADRNQQVSAGAARGLLVVTDAPRPDAILTALRERENDFVRSRLYLAVGRTKDASKLEELRSIASGEKNREATLDAQAAAVKLGGQPERAAFLERVRTARQDQAVSVSDHLLYINDPKLAKGMLPWLSNRSGVLRLGTDLEPRMARMCDLAAFTAYQLGIGFQIEPKRIEKFDDKVIANAAAALRALPD
jgi:hypothetical protein